jgi:hypothetical protein
MNRAMMYSGNKKSSRRIFGTFFDVCQNSSGETMEKRSVNRDPNFPECLNAGIGHLLSSSGEKIKVRFRYSQIRRYLQVAMEAEMATLVSAPQFVQRETSSSQQRRETLHMHKSLGIAKFDNENCSLIAKCQIVEVSDADKSTAAHSSQNAQELRLQMLTIPPLLRPSRLVHGFRFRHPHPASAPENPNCCRISSVPTSHASSGSVSASLSPSNPSLRLSLRIN